tara:strand:- start:98 stop:889 length:792 start_codon:yes stop_codon:yes gene_type:complete
MKSIKIIKKITWYLLRPKYYLQLIILIYKKISLKFSTKSINENLKWCKENSLTTKEALHKITGNNTYIPISTKYSEIFSNANDKIDKINVRMGGSSNLDLIYYCCEYLNATRVVETGVSYGWSSLSILLSLNKRKDSKLVSTDMPYPGLNSEKFVGIAIPKELKKNWVLFSEADIYSIPKALNSFDSIDVCHYDSDKYYEGRKWAYPKLWASLRKGGIFISDDIENNSAFREFVMKVQRTPIIVRLKNNNKSEGFQYNGILIK